ncbi:MAG: hypothetical protein Aureis2KO_31980 [Aureisphaera sp.]
MHRQIAFTLIYGNKFWRGDKMYSNKRTIKTMEKLWQNGAYGHTIYTKFMNLDYRYAEVN